MNDDRKKFDAAVAFLASRVSSGRCIRDPLADLHEALVPFHGKASGNPAALSEKPAESVLWPPEEGKYGRTRDGRKVGPLRWSPKLLKFVGAIDGVLHLWRDPLDAKDFLPRPLDLIAEWKDETPAPDRKALDEMLKDNVAKVAAMSDEERDEMVAAQGKSWARSERGSETSVMHKPALEIREGAWYMRRDGKVKGPAAYNPRTTGSPYPWDVDGMTYANDGSYDIGKESKRDLIREVPAPEASE